MKVVGMAGIASLARGGDVELRQCNRDREKPDRDKMGKCREALAGALHGHVKLCIRALWGKKSHGWQENWSKRATG